MTLNIYQLVNGNFGNITYHQLIKNLMYKKLDI